MFLVNNKLIHNAIGLTLNSVFEVSIKKHMKEAVESNFEYC